MIAENINKIKEHLPEEVTLVAVTKYHTLEETKEVIEAGVLDLGESRVQEFVKKEEALGSEIRWHFIGHLQKNKVKYIIGKTFLIHSVDSLELLEMINKESAKNKVTTNILLQFNLTHEPNKTGFEEEVGMNVLRKVQDYKNVKVMGIMGMGPLTKNNEEITKIFVNLKKIYDRIKEEFQSENIQMKYLSMGMTDDYTIAIKEGSNLVRIGRKIFI